MENIKKTNSHLSLMKGALRKALQPHDHQSAESPVIVISQESIGQIASLIKIKNLQP